MSKPLMGPEEGYFGAFDDYAPVGDTSVGRKAHKQPIYGHWQEREDAVKRANSALRGLLDQYVGLPVLEVRRDPDRMRAEVEQVLSWVLADCKSSITLKWTATYSYFYENGVAYIKSFNVSVDV